MEQAYSSMLPSMEYRVVPLILGLLISLITVGCVERDIVLPNKQVNPQLIVIAYLIDTEPVEIFISSLQPLDSDTIQYGVDDAEVALYRNDTLEALLQYITDSTSCGGGFGPDGQCTLRSSKYISDSSIIIREGATYHVEVTAPRFPSVRSQPVVAIRGLQKLDVRSVVTMTVDPSNQIPALSIDSILVHYEYISAPDDPLYLYLNFDIDNRPERGWTEGVRNPTGDSRLKLDPSANYQEFISPGRLINSYGSVSGSLDLTQFDFSVAITRYPAAYLHFYETITAQDLDISGLYSAPPVPIPTNMIGGGGYFVILENYNVGHYSVE